MRIKSTTKTKENRYMFRREKKAGIRFGIILGKE